MFAEAVGHAAGFTRPVIMSKRDNRGNLASGIGAFVVVNKDGWIVTANHILEQFRILDDQAGKARTHEQNLAAIDADDSLNTRQKKIRRRALRLDPKHVDRFSALWCWSGSRLVAGKGVGAADVAVAKLEPFDPTWVETYPTFKDPEKDIRIGTSLCRLGFPFHEFTPNYDEPGDRFSFPPGAFPPPMFPIEGILTRKKRLVDQSGTELGTFLETSSPGLLGQSGGPIFDRSGAVWAIQSRTEHLPLGFNAKDGSKKAPQQFLHVGIGAFSGTILQLLDELGVSYEKSDY